MAQQNGTVDVQRKNTGWTVIYIKGKKIKNRRKKKKEATVAIMPLGTVATDQNFKKKKKRQSG